MEASPDAAMFDVGDGVLLLEFRSKMNTLGEGVMRMLEAALDRVERGKHTGVVIGNDDPRTFTAGADLALVLRQVSGRRLEGARGERRIVPAARDVAAPHALPGRRRAVRAHARRRRASSRSTPTRVQAHAELYMGLVEVGVGLIPAGGGTKELLFRFTEELAALRRGRSVRGGEARVQADRDGDDEHERARGADARLPARRRSHHDESRSSARRREGARARSRARLRGAAADADQRAGQGSASAISSTRVWAMREAGQTTRSRRTHRPRSSRTCCAGGDGPPREVTEQDMLDLEREAFLSLLGTKETQERIAHMLKTGKPLRN